MRHLAHAFTATALIFAATAAPLGAQNAAAPTIDDLISLKRVQATEISPDGKLVAYTVRETDWDQNQYETSIWIADAQTGATWRLTTGRKSSNAPAWSPDGARIAFASDRTDKRQIYIINPRGGEAEQLTTLDDGVGAFAWSPDGKSIAFTATHPKADADKDREKAFGEFEIIGGDRRLTHLHVVDVATKKVRRLTSGAFAVGRFSWSPDGRQIAFDHRVSTANADGGTADISIVDVGSGAIRALVTTSGPDANPMWSPDGSRIAFETAMGNPAFFYTNTHIAVVAADARPGAPVQDISTSFDEDPSLVRWTPRGLFMSAASRTWNYLYLVDPSSRSIKRFAPTDSWIGSSFSLSGDGSTAAFIGARPDSFPELYVAPLATMRPRKLTDLGAQTAAWAHPPIEVVSWKSRDSTTIEGVLHKPVGYTPGTRYPLLVVIHGGPTGVSRPIPFSSTAIYPIDLWIAKGALVLEPNYRGSAGYGEKFRSLNVRNLGVGDAWDVLSGVDFLIRQGLADSSRVGVMGWSQGGYISAFLTTHDPQRFKAISVGAGISDWTTYYVNTDITPFTRQYLQATPWDDAEIYARTSPMTYIKGAKTPTLIQHGATDQRVPLPNAFELYRGLQDLGVPSRLIVYRGFEGVGHGPSRPKSSRAVMQHNLDWFNAYIWGEPRTSVVFGR
ncbi:MAG TPA: S9 family peptidase [Gemmatimonadaceae bacterium]|nr:S9 family peptidase [Gemmatimonadaceae bacterium]